VAEDTAVGGNSGHILAGPVVEVVDTHLEVLVSHDREQQEVLLVDVLYP